MRLRKLVRADIQLKLTLHSALLTVFALVLQSLLVLSTMSGVSAESAGPGDQHELIMNASLEALLLSLGIVLPLALAVGVLSTFRIAGPLHRFAEFMKETKRGDRPEDCVLRKGDELQDFCALLNEVTEPLRTPQKLQSDEEQEAA
jgi:nitrogen fixation/metabolism regulation signal transduction histidine kinase